MARSELDSRLVLVVDDELEAVLHLIAILEKKGYEVMAAHDGKQALEQFRIRPAAAVITDLQMPEMNGAELIGHLREDAPDLPVVIVSGKVEIDIDNLSTPDAETYLIKKPVDLRELLAKLDQLI